MVDLVPMELLLLLAASVSGWLTLQAGWIILSTFAVMPVRPTFPLKGRSVLFEHRGETE